MTDFKSINDVEEWLEPMDYSGFWYAIEPYALTLQPKDTCDKKIANGTVSKETILYVLKGMARIELTDKFDLEHKSAAPWLKLASSH